MAAARAALNDRIRQSSPMSATKPPSVTSVSIVSTNGTRTTSGMSSLTQESSRYKKHGVILMNSLRVMVQIGENLDALPMMT